MSEFINVPNLPEAPVTLAAVCDHAAVIRALHALGIATVSPVPDAALPEETKEHADLLLCHAGGSVCFAAPGQEALTARLRQEGFSVFFSAPPGAAYPEDIRLNVAVAKDFAMGRFDRVDEELTAFLPQVTIPPALVQNEIHPYYQEQEVVPFIQEKGIAVQCWYPLGGRGYTAELLGNETIQAIAEAHGVSAAQVILRWDLQRGIVVIPGSGNPEHIKENLDLFGFELSDSEMEEIRALDRGEKHDWY